MAKIRCFYEDCLFLKKGYCVSPIVQFDPEDGCLTYQIKELKEEEDNDALLDLISGDDDELEDLYEDDDGLYNEWDEDDEDEVY